MSSIANATLLALAASAPDFGALAALSPVPPACRNGGSSAWQTPKGGATASFCDRLAQASAKLSRSPKLALQAAEALHLDFPRAPEPAAVMARASLRLGDRAKAWALWKEAVSSGLQLQAPRLQLDYARSAAAVGELPVALDQYRRLAARIATFREEGARRRIVLEAASAAARAGAPAAEVAGYLASAQRGSPPPPLQAYARSALSWLALLRPDLQAAQPLRVSEAGARWLSRAAEQPSSHPELPRVAAEEVAAVASFAIEPFDGERALELWDTYAAYLNGEEAKAPDAWRIRAKARLDQLRGASQ